MRSIHSSGDTVSACITCYACHSLFRASPTSPALLGPSYHSVFRYVLTSVTENTIDYRCRALREERRRINGKFSVRDSGANLERRTATRKVRRIRRIEWNRIYGFKRDRLSNLSHIAEVFCALRNACKTLLSSLTERERFLIRLCARSGDDAC